MISIECFSPQWIDEISAKLEYKDKSLIEKVIRALSLLEMLVQSGCPLTFKGGTALMLILGQSLHRLSIDIDIICPPETEIEQYLKTCRKHGFIRYQQVNKESAGTDVPVSHAKVFYQIAYTDRSEKNEYIRLDVLYENCPYSNIQQLPIKSPFVKLDGEPLNVNVPKKEDILGDKMTAFAPNTIGIPFFKNDRECNMEIIKQLYDINRLFENVDDFRPAFDTFQKVSKVELGYRGLEGRLNEFFEDVRQTAICIATRGQAGKGDIKFFLSGIKRVKSFMYKEKYQIEEAIKDASRAAYLATCFEKGILDIKKYSGNPQSAVGIDISDALPAKLRKLKNISPEAYYYWSMVDAIINNDNGK